MKNLEDMQFNELVEAMTRDIHSALLKGGGAMMQSAVHAALATGNQWYQKVVIEHKGVGGEET